MIKLILAALLTLACASGFAAVDVNKANQAELEAVKGIGPSLATRILDGRKASPYADWSDFAARVKGVGPGNSVRFSADGLTVAGASYAAQPATATNTPRKAGKANKAAPASAKAMP
jgi:competence protein ComEA